MFTASAEREQVAGMFRLLEIFLQNNSNTNVEFSKEVNNPLSESVFKSLARIESKYNMSITPQSFRDGGKTIQGFTVSKFITDRAYDLSSEFNGKTLRKHLSELPFSESSLWLKLLNEDPDKFREKFGVTHLGINALKEHGKKIYGTNAIAKLADADHELTKIGMFQDEKLGEQKDYITPYGIFKMRIAKLFSPTMSDKTTMTLVKTAVLDLNKDNFIVNPETKEIEADSALVSFMYDQLIKPELLRIADFYSKGGATNIKNYDKGAGMFLMFPQANKLTISTQDGKTIPLTEALKTKKISLDTILKDENVTGQINNLLQGYLQSELTKKLKVWEDSGFITKKTNEFGKTVTTGHRFFDKEYMKKFENKELTIDAKIQYSALDFIINNLIGNTNSMMTFAGDPAMYYKSKSSDPIQQSKDTFNNIGKRLANQIAPGNVLADSANNKYLQIFLEDISTSATNIQFLAKVLEGKTLSEERLQEWKDILKEKNPEIQKSKKSIFLAKHPKIADYFEIEGTDAQEYTTWQEHLYILEKLGKTPDIINKDGKDKITIEQINKAREIFSSGVAFESLSEKNKVLVELVMQPIKPVYTGQIFDKAQGVMRTVYIKSSSFPLIPQITNGMEIDKLRLAMEKLENESIPKDENGKKLNLRPTQTVRASYQSANKIGGLSEPVKLFDDSTGEMLPFKEDELYTKIANTTLELNRSDFRIQQDVPFKTAKRLQDTVSQGTQTTKLLMGDGVTDMKGFDYNGNPNTTGKKLLDNYTELFDNLANLKKNQIYNELGIDVRTGKAFDIKKSAKKLQKILKEEAENRGYSRQVIESLTVDFKEKNGKIIDAEFKLPLWISAESNRFESLLNAVVTNRIAKIKMPGNTYVAASQEGFTHLSDYAGDKSKIIYTSNWDGKQLRGAEFDEDGNLKKTQVFLPSKFRDNKGNILDLFKTDSDGNYIYINDEGNRFTLKEEMFDAELLSNISFRIPTSSHQSMVDIEIVGILPYETGDLMIVPRNLTVQVGLDFDIDKQTNYQLYHTVNEETGKVEVTTGNIENLKSNINSARKNLRNENYIRIEDEIREAKQKISNDIAERDLNISFTKGKKEKYKELHTELVEKEQLLQNQIDIIDNEISNLATSRKEIKGVNLEKATNDEISTLKKERKEKRKKKRKVFLEIQQLERKTDIKRAKKARNLEKTRNIDNFTNKIKTKQNRIKKIKENELFVKSSEELYEKLLKNEIIKIHSSILSNPQMQSKISKVLSMDNARKQGANIDELKNPTTEEHSDDYFTPMSDEYQKATMMAGADGQIGIGAYSNDVVTHSLVRQNSEPISLVEIIIDENGKQKLVNKVITFGNFKSDGRLGGFPDGKTLDGKRDISEVLTERQNIATDNAKELVMNKVNLNSETLDVDKVLVLLGFDNDKDGISIPFYFLSQPIIVDYVKMMGQAKANISGFIEDRDAHVYEQLAAKYGFDPAEESVNFDKQMTGQKLKSEISRFANNERVNNQEAIAFQRAILNKFLNLKVYGTHLRKIQQNLNIDSKGIGKSTFDTIERIKRIEDLATQETLIHNAKVLVGDYANSPSTIDEKNKLLDQGYIELDKFFIKPTTVAGSLAVNTLSAANDLWSKYLPYNSPVMTNLFHEIMEARGLSDESSVETKQQILREIKKYVNSMDFDLYNFDPDAERTRLFIDSDKENNKNTSLARYLNELKYLTEHPVINSIVNKNKLIERLEYDVNSNGQPSLIQFNNAVGENFDEDVMYNALLVLMDKKIDLPSFNGKEYNTRLLAQDLINYALLEGGVQEAVQFTKFIPISFLNKTNFAKRLRELQNDLYREDGGVFGIVNPDYKIAISKPYLTSKFTKQYAQNNPELMPSIDQQLMKDKKGKSNSPDSFVALLLGDKPKPFLSVYNPKANKNFDLYIFDGIRYIKIPTRGAKFMNEYNAQATNTNLNKSIVENPVFQQKSKSIDYKKQNVDTEPVESNKSAFKIDQGDIATSIEEVANSNYKGLSQMAKALLPFIDPTVKLASVEMKYGRGVYIESKHAIGMNSNKMDDNPEDIARTLLHEYIHSITIKELRKHITFKKNSQGELTQEIDYVNDGAPQFINDLVRLFNDTNSHFKKDLIAVKAKISSQQKLSKYEKRVVYGGKNLFEFLALANTSPEFQEYMSNTKFKQTGLSIFERFRKIMDTMLSELGLKFENPTIATEAINATFALLKYAKETDTKVVNEKVIEKDSELINKTDDYLEAADKIQKEIDGVASGITSMSDITNHSGGAQGADTVWENIGLEFGVNEQVNYTTKDYDKLNEKEKSDLEDQYKAATLFLGRKILSPNSYGGKLVRRDMLQANSGDSIIGITELVKPGIVGRKGYSNKTKYSVPEGGTGYAIARGIALGKPVYVFNQSADYGNEIGWYQWDELVNDFMPTDTPILTKNFTGIGASTIYPDGIVAIRDVYQKTEDTINGKSEPTSKIFTNEIDSDIPKNISIYQNENGLYDVVFGDNDFPMLIKGEVSSYKKAIEIAKKYANIPYEGEALGKGKYELFPGVYANKGQEEAIDLMSEFLKSSERVFLLEGKGGTGKTTIVKKVIEDLPRGTRIIGIAPSHKAKKVLKKSFSDQLGRVETMTLASALAIRLKESTGKFEADIKKRKRGEFAMVNQDTVFIIDETSMVSDKLFDRSRYR